MRKDSFAHIMATCKYKGAWNITMDYVKVEEKWRVYILSIVCTGASVFMGALIFYQRPKDAVEFVIGGALFLILFVAGIWSGMSSMRRKLVIDGEVFMYTPSLGKTKYLHLSEIKTIEVGNYLGDRVMEIVSLNNQHFCRLEFNMKGIISLIAYIYQKNIKVHQMEYVESMFEGFDNLFEVTNKDSLIELNDDVRYLAERRLLRFMMLYGGKEFGNGVYRVFDTRHLGQATKAVINFFPEFEGHLEIVAYDWLGRCYGYELRRGERSGMMVVFDRSRRKFERLSVDVLEFHNQFMAEHKEEYPAISLYENWLKNQKQPQKDECVGFTKVEKFGMYDQANYESFLNELEIVSIKEYWRME